MMDVLKDLTCPVCLELFTCPIILPCGHVLCKSPCAMNIFEDDAIRCPVCRENSYVDGGMTSLPRVISLESIIDKVKAVLSQENRVDYPSMLLSSVEHEAETSRATCDINCTSTFPAINQPIADHNLNEGQSKRGTATQNSAPHDRDTSTFFFWGQQSLDSKLKWLVDKTLNRTSFEQSATEPEDFDHKNCRSSDSDKQSFQWSEDDEVQSILFTNSQKRNSPNCYFTPLDHIGPQCSYNNRSVEFQQTIVDRPMGSSESQTNEIPRADLIPSSKLTNRNYRKSIESPKLKLPGSRLDVIHVARMSDIAMHSSHDSWTLDSRHDSWAVDRHSLIEPELKRLGMHNPALQTELDEQFESLSNIQRQLSLYQMTYNHQMHQLQTVLERQRSAFNVECRTLSSDVDAMRRDLISSLVEDTNMTELGSQDVPRNTAMPQVGGVSALTELRESVSAFSPATLRSCIDQSASGDSKNIHHINIPEVNCAPVRNHVIELSNRNYGLKNFDFPTPLVAPPTSPKKPVIDTQRSSRNSDTVVLALAPQRDVISHYEVKFSSAEQKRLDIEETLLAQECTGIEDATRYVIIDNVCRSTNYYFRVVAWCRDVRGPDSDVVQCRTLDSRDCVVPIPGVIETLCHVSSTSAEVNCPCSPPMTQPDLSYTLLHREEAARGHNVWTGAATHGQVVCGVTGLRPDTDYQFVVLVTNSRGECQLSEKLMLRTKTH